MKKTTRRRKKTRTRKKKEELDENEELPIYKKLYPPLKNLFVYDENNEIGNKLLEMKSDISKSKRKKKFLEDEEQELDENFLSKLVQVPCVLSKQKVVDTISKFIQKSKLIEKMANDYESAEKKVAVATSLSKGCAEKLHYEIYETGEIIFKIGDTGENFYFILSGNVSVLKLKQIPNIQMTYMEYIRYCIYLLNQGEEYLLSEVLKANENVLNVSSIEDMKLINKIVFMKRLYQDINKKIVNNKQLKKYFVTNAQKFSDYDLKQEELDYIEQEKLRGKPGAGKEWEEYITKHCSLLVSEQVFFHSYEKVLTDDESKNIICYCYEPFLYLGPGLYFGDTALDFDNNKRNATIRVEEKTYLAYLQRDDYLNIISPMNKLERIKEIEFIYLNYFFFNINSHIFEKNFFHLFSHREYYRGSILFSSGIIPQSLILVKTGRISLELKCSIIDIQNLIKFLFDNIFFNPLFKRLSQMQKNMFMSPQKMNNIKSYINDPVLMRLKTHNRNFIEEMKISRNYTISILTNQEVIGLEEIFLRIPYIMKASVISNKVECYEISLDNLDRILNSGREVIFAYLRYTMNKISTLIERLQNIKQNYINMSLAKYEVKAGNNKLKNNLSIDTNYKIISKDLNEEIKTNNNNKLYQNNFNYQFNSDSNTGIFIENRAEFMANDGKRSPSPIKIFMTSLSPQTQTRFEEMKIAYSKMRRTQLKKNNDNYIKNTSNYRKNNSYSVEMNPIKKKVKEKKKNIETKYKTASVVYATDDKLNTKYLIDNLFVENTEEKNKTIKCNEVDNESTVHHKFNVHKRDKMIQEPSIKQNTFNFSFIPLNLWCQKEEKNKTYFNNINDLLTTKKNIHQIFSTKNTNTFNENLFNNENKNNKLDFKSKTVSDIIKNKRRINFQKKLKAINKNVNISSVTKENNTEKTNNIIPRKIIITGIIKDFYKDIKLNGYSSVIKNRKLNTIYLRKFNKKYDSAEKVYQKINVQLLQKSNSLPQIF